MVSKNTGIHLGAASGVSRNKESDHSKGTEYLFPIRNADGKDIGQVARHLHKPDKWTFKLFGRENLPVSIYDSKEEALAGAIAAYSGH